MTCPGWLLPGRRKQAVQTQSVTRRHEYTSCPGLPEDRSRQVAWMSRLDLQVHVPAPGTNNLTFIHSFPFKYMWNWDWRHLSYIAFTWRPGVPRSPTVAATTAYLFMSLTLHQSVKTRCFSITSKQNLSIVASQQYVRYMTASSSATPSVYDWLLESEGTDLACVKTCKETSDLWL